MLLTIIVFTPRTLPIRAAVFQVLLGENLIPPVSLDHTKGPICDKFSDDEVVNSLSMSQLPRHHCWTVPKSKFMTAARFLSLAWQGTLNR